MKIGIQTWGSDGDIRPFLALAGGLSAGGHDVSLVVTSVDNKDYSSYAGEMNFRISHIGKPSVDEETIRLLMNKLNASRNSLKQVKMIMALFFNPLIPEMYEASQRLCEENDAIIGHFIHYPIQTAAEKFGKPYATVLLNHAGVFSRNSVIFGVPNLGKWLKPFWIKLANLVVDREMGPEVNALRKREHLPPAKNIMNTVWVSTQLNLLAVSAVLCRRQPDWPDYHQVCGFFNMPNAAEEWIMPVDLKRFIDSGPPPVFITLGSMLFFESSPHGIMETLARGALLAGCRAIVQSRWDDLPDFPDNPNIYKIKKAPHQFIFPYCSAVVHHGGSGTTHSAMRHGCPSVVIEHFTDQSFFASELRRVGLAPRVLHRRNITAKKLAKAIRNVLDSPDMKKRAEELGALMQKENGVKTAVELIENRFPPQHLPRTI